MVVSANSQAYNIEVAFKEHMGQLWKATADMEWNSFL